MRLGRRAARCGSGRWIRGWFGAGGLGLNGECEKQAGK